MLLMRTATSLKCLLSTKNSIYSVSQLQLSSHEKNGKEKQGENNSIIDDGHQMASSVINKEDTKEVISFLQNLEKYKTRPRDKFPTDANFLIIGGGAVGSSIAYWLKEHAGSGLNVTIVERDLTYGQCSAVKSCGGIRHQYSIKQNIQLSLFAAEFLRDVKKYLAIPETDPPDIYFQQRGYLTLASAEGAETLNNNTALQM